ncbi:MAG TPA: hypothetical protein VNV66_19670 [Pilimelia sp.]|nr:hypothetical protein [Pilimelia sp.]
MVALAAAMAAGALGLASPAAALVSNYPGGGYSEDILNRQFIRACDTNADGNGVYANFWETGQSNHDTVTNNQGARTCNGATSGSTRLIRAHIIFINLAWRPDPHGPCVSY